MTNLSLPDRTVDGIKELDWDVTYSSLNQTFLSVITCSAVPIGLLI